jgi:uncharacterized protein YerC
MSESTIPKVKITIDGHPLWDVPKPAADEIERLTALNAEYETCCNLNAIHMRDQDKRIAELEAENQRLRAAVDAACESIETQSRVGRSIDYANGFMTGVQCQRLHAKSARDKALAAKENDV